MRISGIPKHVALLWKRARPPRPRCSVEHAPHVVFGGRLRIRHAVPLSRPAHVYFTAAQMAVFIALLALLAPLGALADDDSSDYTPCLCGAAA